MQEKIIKEAKNLIDTADSILITAGAGMGVDSGLPDFRGDEGFWKAYPVIKDLGISFQNMANPKWFNNDPSLAWAFYGHRLNLYRDTVPHAGFQMLLDLVQKKNNDYFIYTSNVDGQFQKAGFDENRIVEVHGSIHHFQCADNCQKNIWEADKGPIAIDMEKFKALDIPLCKHCRAVARPNILMFGDWGWNGNRTNQQENRFYRWLKSIHADKKKLVIIEIGAGSAIPTVRQEGEHLADSSQDYRLIRINPREYAVKDPDNISIPLGGLEGIEKILLKDKV
jgi:NAD-dependent SIR2 family protein deacetylase